MARNFEKASKKYSTSDVGLIFLQKFHWLNVQFLLKKPSKTAIFKYYFGRFPGITINNIDAHVRALNNAMLLKYWLKVSDFS